MKPILDHVRWGELSVWLGVLGAVLSALQSAPLPEHVRGWLGAAVAVVAFVVAYLRNPKSLDWLDEAQAAAEAIKEAREK